jgi:adenylyltransferase/sulfurtransferase
VTSAHDRADIERYSRHLLLPQVGMPGQSRLAGSRVAVVGAGGLGCPALLYLAAAGVGTLGVIDDDTVELSNLQRQVLHATGSVGLAKTASAAQAITDLNPGVTVVEHAVRLDPGNATDLLRGYHLVVDGSDTFATRYAVSDACTLLGVPHVWGSVLRFDGQASVWWAGHGPCYRCVFPQPPPPDAVPSCDAAGVLGAVCAAIGAVLASETLKLLLGVGDPLLGRLLVHDALRQTWDTVTVRADPACPDHVAQPARPAVDPAAPAPAPPPVGGIEPTALAAYLGSQPRAVLVDVRGEAERGIVAIPGSVPIELELFRSGAAFDRPELADPAAPLVLYCKNGPRSQEAALLVARGGRSGVRVLTGGVVRWVDEVAPDLPRY